jgi:hypothetical protein
VAAAQKRDSKRQLSHKNCQSFQMKFYWCLLSSYKTPKKWKVFYVASTKLLCRMRISKSWKLGKHSEMIKICIKFKSYVISYRCEKFSLFILCCMLFRLLSGKEWRRIKRKKSLPVDSTIPHICTSTESWDTQTHIYLVMYNKTAETGCDLWWQKRVISITTATWEKKGKKFVNFFLCVMGKMAVQ